MLSRVANSIYWMARYLGRAVNTSRFIEVHFELMLDQPSTETEQWAPLVQVSGDFDLFIKRYGGASRHDVMQFLTFDTDNDNSVLTSLARARENARTAREHLPSDLWEAVNTFYLKVRDAGQMGMGADQDISALYRDVKACAQRICGIVEGLMTRGDGYHFFQAGCHLEQADKTSRLLDVKYFLLLPDLRSVGTPLDMVQWAALLRSFGALETYRRQYGAITPYNVASFLILDRCFPRSILYCLERTDRALRATASTTHGRDHTPAAEHLGQLCGELWDHSMDGIFQGGLHEFIEALQGRLNQIDHAIYASYFDLTRPAAFRAARLDTLSECVLENLLAGV